MSSAKKNKSGRIPVRRKMREVVFQVIFGADISGFDSEKDLEFMVEDIFIDDKFFNDEMRNIAYRYCKGIVSRKDDLDEIIKRYLFNWSWDRLQFVDKNILRLATYELLYESSIPVEVSLNEAVEIAKIYGTEKSGKFVNGILDSIAKELVPKEKFLL